MSAVVMECRIQVCASAQRIAGFVRHAEVIVDQKMSDEVSRSVRIADSGADLLRRQWDLSHHSHALSEPQLKTLELAFSDTSGFLTPAQLESLSRELVWELDIPSGDDEVVPWILTLTTETDRVARDDIHRRHPTLDGMPQVTMAV